MDETRRLAIERLFRRGEWTAAETARTLGVHRSQLCRRDFDWQAAHDLWMAHGLAREEKAVKKRGLPESVEFERVDRILSKWQRANPMPAVRDAAVQRAYFDRLIDLPYHCPNCDRRAVDRQTFRRLVHGDDQYRFPTRCPKCASSAKPRIA